MSSDDKRVARGSTPAGGATPRGRISRTFGDTTLRDHPAALVVLAAGLAISLMIFGWARARERQASRLEFERRASRTVASFRTNLERPLEVVRTLPALFEASDDVTRAEFSAFARPALSRHPDIMGLAWVPRVTASERMAFEDAGRREGQAGFAITELEGSAWVRAGDRPEYFPIVYVEPIFPSFLGYDEASESRRAEAIARARDTGAPAASRKIALLGDDSRVSGMIVFVPIYRRGSTPETVELRRQELRGFVVEVFRFGSAFEGLKKLEDLRGLELELFDVTDPEHPELLHALRDPAAPPAEDLVVTRGAAHELAHSPEHDRRVRLRTDPRRRGLGDIGSWTETEATAWWSTTGDALVLAVRADSARGGTDHAGRRLTPPARSAVGRTRCAARNALR